MRFAPASCRRRTVGGEVLVTDGQVGNEDHILRKLSPELKNVRVYALGIDSVWAAARRSQGHPPCLAEQRW